MSKFSININVKNRYLKPYFYPAALPCQQRAVHPKTRETKTFMVELGLCQVWASKRKHAHRNSK